MPVPIPVAILGFSAFDRKALASYFQLTGRTRPRYAHVLNADLADLVIADADEPGVLELLRTLGRVQDALFIGALAPPEAAAWMMRPITRPDSEVAMVHTRLPATKKANPIPTSRRRP